MKKIFLIICILSITSTLVGQKNNDFSYYFGSGAPGNAASIIYGQEIAEYENYQELMLFHGIQYIHNFTSKHGLGFRIENSKRLSQVYKLKESFIDDFIKKKAPFIGIEQVTGYSETFALSRYSKAWSIVPTYYYTTNLNERNVIISSAGLHLKHYIPYSVSRIFRVFYKDSSSNSQSEVLPLKFTSYTNSEYLNGQYDRSQFISLGVDLGFTYKRIIGKAKKHALSVGVNLHYEPRYSIYSKYETTADSPVYSKGIFMMNGHSVNLQFGYHWLF